MISADTKTDLNRQEIKELVSASAKKYLLKT